MLGPVSWSPDGGLITATDGRRLEVIAADGTGNTTLADGVRVAHPSFRPGT
jgi:hypothetical protein